MKQNHVMDLLLFLILKLSKAFNDLWYWVKTLPPYSKFKTAPSVDIRHDIKSQKPVLRTKVKRDKQQIPYTPVYND